MRFFYANGILFNAARSPFFVEMVQANNNVQTGYRPLGSNKLNTTLIDKEKH